MLTCWGSQGSEEHQDFGHLGGSRRRYPGSRPAVLGKIEQIHGVDKELLEKGLGNI